MAVALTLLGCTTPTPKADTKSRHTEAAPLFATEEEALAAAEEAYARYLSVSNLIASEGGAAPERIEPYVTADWLEEELKSFASFAASGITQIGSITTNQVQLDLYVEVGQGGADLSMFVCADFTNVSYVNSSGIEVAPPERPDMVTLLIELASGRAGQFKVAHIDAGTGVNKC